MSRTICRQKMELFVHSKDAKAITWSYKRYSRASVCVCDLISSLVHSIARACSVGVTTKCSCGALPNHPPHEDFKWGGCGDDLKYGLYFSEQFTDAELMKKGKIRKSKKSQMNSHNNAVGRLMVAKSMTTACKCHGVSGSCSVKTCWRSLPDFSVIGTTLKKFIRQCSGGAEKKAQKQAFICPIAVKCTECVKRISYLFYKISGLLQSGSQNRFRGNPGKVL